jgi:hypothetical protein
VKRTLVRHRAIFGSAGQFDNFRVGSITVLTARKRDFRSTPNNGHRDVGRVGPLSARLGLSIMPEIPLSAGQLVSFIASGNNRSAKLVVEQRRDILSRDGLTEQIALSLSTSIGFEICQLTGVFHTLSSGC